MSLEVDFAMLRDLAAGQALLVGGVLLFAAFSKVRWLPHNPRTTGTALNALVGDRFAPVAWSAVATIEVALAGLLLARVAYGLASPATSVFLLSAALFLWFSRRHHPDSSCGCFGADDGTPITSSAIIRAAILSLLSLGPVLAGHGDWTRVLGEPTVALVLIIETGVLLAMLPELRQRWNDKPEWSRERDLRRAVRVVKNAPTFGSRQGELRSTTPTDVWSQPGTGYRIVMFELAPNGRQTDQPGREHFLGFAVAGRSQVVHVGELELRAGVDGWQASHLPPT
jgi:hypothetical protein